MADEQEDPPIGTAQNAADVARKAELTRAEFTEAFDQITGAAEELLQRLKELCSLNDWNFKVEYHSADGLWDAEAYSSQPLAKPLREGFVDRCAVKNAGNVHFALRSLLTYMQINRLA